MKPYEHYLEAERLLAQVADTDITNSWETEMIIARAAVHAQLGAMNAETIALPADENTINLNDVKGYLVQIAQGQEAHFHPTNVKIITKSRLDQE